RCGECCMATRPAGWGADVVPQLAVQAGPVLLANGAPRVLKRAPEEAVVSLETIVLLMRSTTSASSRDTPAPSHPATLFTMMLFVILTEFHCLGRLGNSVTSVPLTFCKRMPPPLPLSAAFPLNRFALITRLGPVPSLSPGVQSASAAVPPHSVPGALPAGAPSGGVPMAIKPPPLVGTVGLVL